MRASANELAAAEVDILVVGAGIFGASVACVAARAGYSVALVDKGDFGGATSANHYKFIHSGIRYLQHLDVVRVRVSNHDRRVLMKLVPHLTRNMPVVYPTYGYGKKSKFLMRTAMFVFDSLTLDRNWGISDERMKIPGGLIMGRDELLANFPGVDKENLTGAAVFCDGQMHNPPRIVLSFVKTAHQSGALVANYMNATSLIREDARIRGANVKDVLTGEEFPVRSRIVINAAGPWAFELYENDAGIAVPRKPTFSRDLAFVINRSLNPEYAIACTSRMHDADAIFDRGGRHLFLVPWRGKTLVGVWHKPEHSVADRIVVSEGEMTSYLDEINATYNGLDASLDDVEMINAGHILFGTASTDAGPVQHRFAKRSLLLDHRSMGLSGLLTVVGARATVAPSMAAKAVHLAAKQIGTKAVVNPLHDVPLQGGSFDSFESLRSEISDVLCDAETSVTDALARNYGSDFINVVKCAGPDARMTPFDGSTTVHAEVVHAIRNEAAQCLDDIIFRRTDLATGGGTDRNTLAAAAAIAAGEAKWSEATRDEQVATSWKKLKNRGPWHFISENDDQ